MEETEMEIQSVPLPNTIRAGSEIVELNTIDKTMAVVITLGHKVLVSKVQLPPLFDSRSLRQSRTYQGCTTRPSDLTLVSYWMMRTMTPGLKR